MPAPAVSLRNITRRFGTLVANDDVSLELRPGEIHALVGENGAGKSTLMHILYGLLAPDAGRIEIGGSAGALGSPAEAMKHGLGMVHQHFMLVDPLTVAENVTLGHEPRAAFGRFDRRAAEQRVASLAERHRLAVDPRARIETLSVGAQQRVEILKALHHGARVLILDEPTAVLTPHEVDDLFQVLRALQAEGVTIVLITHKLAEVKALANRVTVLRGGRVVGQGEVASLTVEQIAEWMVGRPLATLHARATHQGRTPLLEVRMLDVLDDRGLPAVKRVSFEASAGEIVGIAGVEGNGQHELIEAIAGLRQVVRGEVVIAGRAVTRGGARTRFAAGLAHIPSDRLRRGLVPPMTLAENLVLGLHREPALGRGPLLSRRTLLRRAGPLLEGYDVRPPDPLARARQLSGGNQQKLIAARELSRGAAVILAAHPTRGVDLGAIAFLHQRLLKERDAGRAVLLVSSELSELLALSDRIFVLYEGRLMHETRPSETDERSLGLYMTGRDPGTARVRLPGALRRPVTYAPLLAVIVALAVGAVFILAIGERPLEIYALMLRESLGTGYGIGQTLFRATPLVFTGLAVALGFRAGLFNIGVEGQLYLGGFAAALTGVALLGQPAILVLPAALLAAAAAGAVWGGIPGVLKARFGAHEVINTIMLNFVAFALASWIGRWVFEPATVRTAAVGPEAWLPRLDVLFPALRGSPANVSLLLAVLVAALVGVFLFRARRGYELRAVGLNAPAAEYGGISVGGTQVTAMALSGAIAGLGGVNFVLGYKHFFELGFSAGAGFLGIAVALLAGNHPVGVIGAALFFGALSAGALAISQRVPRELVEVLQAVVILVTIALQALLERAARRR